MTELEMRLELGKMGYTKDEVERMLNPGAPEVTPLEAAPPTPETAPPTPETPTSETPTPEAEQKGAPAMNINLDPLYSTLEKMEKTLKDIQIANLIGTRFPEEPARTAEMITGEIIAPDNFINKGGK